MDLPQPVAPSRLSKILSNKWVQNAIRFLLPFLLFVLFSPGIVFQLPVPENDKKGGQSKKPPYLLTGKTSVSSAFIHALLFSVVLIAVTYFWQKHLKKIS